VARLFVALWPDATVRAGLARYRDAWAWPASARPVPDERLHLTLHFIGAFPRERIGALADALAAVPTRPATLRPQAAELWRGGVAVLRLTDDANLKALHGEIGAVLSALEVPLDARSFAPHVTMARRAGGAKRPLEPPRFEWQANGFALVQSSPGRAPAYEVLQVFGEPS
jgi:2'-5' RNA ligase